eukprot:25671_1
MSKSSVKGKIRIKMAFIIISIYISFTKSFANCVFNTNIITLDPLEAQQIKTLPLSMYIWSSIYHFCGIYKNYDICIQNPLLYQYGHIIPFTLSNNGRSWSVHMCLLMNDDISAYVVCHKKNWVINSKINSTSNDNRYSTMLDSIISSIKSAFHYSDGPETYENWIIALESGW